MLGVHGVGRDGADYYLSDLARELPEPVPGRWTGAAAAALGLERALHPEEFRRLLRGRQPRTGQPMGSGRASVAAFDLTFSAPKSASVLFALGGEEAARRVLEGHAAAVAGALGYLEQHGVTAIRRSGPERSVVATTGMIAAEFTHGVNRNGDPHLHSHVVMANLVHAADGRWSACDGRGIAAHRPAASEVYAAHLRAALSSALGVSWAGTPGRPYEVVGVKPELLGEFSSPRSRHPPSHARGGRTLGASRPRGVGGHPPRQAARGVLRRALTRVGAAGPRRRGLHGARAGRRTPATRTVPGR